MPASSTTWSAQGSGAPKCPTPTGTAAELWAPPPPGRGTLQVEEAKDYRKTLAPQTGSRTSGASWCSVPLLTALVSSGPRFPVVTAQALAQRSSPFLPPGGVKVM